MKSIVWKPWGFSETHRHTKVQLTKPLPWKPGDDMMVCLVVTVAGKGSDPRKLAQADISMTKGVEKHPQEKVLSNYDTCCSFLKASWVHFTNCAKGGPTVKCANHWWRKGRRLSVSPLFTEAIYPRPEKQELMRKEWTFSHIHIWIQSIGPRKPRRSNFFQQLIEQKNNQNYHMKKSKKNILFCFWTTPLKTWNLWSSMILILWTIWTLWLWSFSFPSSILSCPAKNDGVLTAVWAARLVKWTTNHQHFGF